MLFFAEMWERFSFYGMRALLTLYLTMQLFEHLADPEKKAKAIGIYAAYGALVYATPFLGGIIADKLLGFRKSVILGGVLMMIGHFVMAIETELFLYIALAFLIIGNGFFKPNVSSIVGGLYKEGDPRRDGGFTIFYMGINLGAALAPLICGYIGETYGWFYGFGLAGVGMLLGLIVFTRGQDKLEDNGVPPNLEYLKSKVFGVSRENLVYILSIVSVALFVLLVKYYELMSLILTPFVAGVLLYIFFIAIRSEKVEREKMFVILILLFFTTLFWAFFEQAGSSITLFTAENVDRSFFGLFEVKASIFQSVNPTFIILLGPLFASMWIKLNKAGKEPSTPLKFALGLFQLGAGFLVMVFGAQFLSVNENAVLIPMVFLVLGYFLHTTGELCLSPVGLSMVTKLAPKRIGAMVMGAWFLSSAMAHHIGGIIAMMTSGGDSDQALGVKAVSAGLIDTVEGSSVELLSSFDGLATYNEVFGALGWIAVGASVALLLLIPILKKWMHGVN
jgi:POT family proton-dependent oligopeptide transporter